MLLQLNRFRMAQRSTLPTWDILVGRHSTKTTRTYVDGHANDWVRLFQADLMTGFFARPESADRKA